MKTLCVLLLLLGACAKQEKPSVGSIEPPADYCGCDDGRMPAVVEILSQPPIGGCPEQTEWRDVSLKLPDGTVTSVTMQEVCHTDKEFERTLADGGSAVFDKGVDGSWQLTSVNFVRFFESDPCELLESPPPFGSEECLAALH